jgi:GT2 family glycosyltransferase
MVQGSMAPPFPEGPRITVIVLLYRAAREAPGLVQAVLAQRNPAVPEQSRWLEALFMDDASPDGTARALEDALVAAGSPPHCRAVLNPENLGLAATLNKALGLVRTPYVLTCHLDCRFGREDYVAAMVDLLDRHPRAGAITGQPRLRDLRALPFAEKLNVVTNLMDIFPSSGAGELVPVGFAEGRCDAFRLEALHAAGLYDATLRTAGEDQVLAAKLRAQGYEVYQAPALPYVLSVSGEQDTVLRLARHQWLFGLAHPYILLRAGGTSQGVMGGEAGRNRRARALLRLAQVGSTAALAFAAGALLLGLPAWVPAAVVGLVALVKLGLFARHLRTVRLSLREQLSFWLAQPLLDAAYTVGLGQGLRRALLRSRRPIG